MQWCHSHGSVRKCCNHKHTRAKYINLMYRLNQISFKALFIVPAPSEFLWCPATDNETKRDSTAAGSEEMLKWLYNHQLFPILCSCTL